MHLSDLPRLSIRDTVENCTLRRMGSLRASGKALFNSLDSSIYELSAPSTSKRYKNWRKHAYLTLQCFEERQTRMPGYLADEPPLLVKIHPLKVWLVTREDLIGLRYDPDLRHACKPYCPVTVDQIR